VRARRDPPHRIGASAPTGALLAALALVLWPAQLARAGAVDLPGSVQLSNERTFTRWAYAAQALPIHETPKPSSPMVATVALATEEGLRNVYTLLDSWTDPTGQTWLRTRAPMRSTPTVGWVEATAFSPAHVVRTQLIVDRRHLRATLYRAGHRIWRSAIGVGKERTPTPPGHFWIRERLHTTDPNGPYGPWAFGTSAYSRLSDWPGGGVIGIHGTDQPGLIPGRPSHGCIRVPNAAIRRLAHLMPVGTPVRIR
jgi:L,D-transpeptidase catalytic domain